MVTRNNDYVFNNATGNVSKTIDQSKIGCREQIKNLRVETGLSQSKFAQHFGIPVRTLQSWEAAGGSIPPTYVPGMMKRILELEQKLSDM